MQRQLLRTVAAADGSQTCQYSAFRALCKAAISEELRTGKYGHLRGCNTRGSSLAPPYALKARVNIIGRSPELVGTGYRSMELGGLEVVVEIKAPFKERNFGNGFDMAGHSFRVAIGPALGGYEELSDHITEGFLGGKAEMRQSLQQGDYATFVRQTLTIVNNAMHRFKAGMDLLHAGLPQ